MAPRVTISSTEILDELRASFGAVERPAGFLTVQEMANELKCTRNSVVKKLAEWQSQGRLESLTVYGTRSDGIKHRVKAYRLKKAKR